MEMTKYIDAGIITIAVAVLCLYSWSRLPPLPKPDMDLIDILGWLAGSR
jgi:hypothetical protein